MRATCRPGQSSFQSPTASELSLTPSWGCLRRHSSPASSAWNLYPSITLSGRTERSAEAPKPPGRPVARLWSWPRGRHCRWNRRSLHWQLAAAAAWYCARNRAGGLCCQRDSWRRYPAADYQASSAWWSRAARTSLVGSGPASPHHWSSPMIDSTPTDGPIDVQIAILRTGMPL